MNYRQKTESFSLFKKECCEKKCTQFSKCSGINTKILWISLIPEKFLNKKYKTILYYGRCDLGSKLNYRKGEEE